MKHLTQLFAFVQNKGFQLIFLKCTFAEDDMYTKFLSHIFQNNSKKKQLRIVSFQIKIYCQKHRKFKAVFKKNTVFPHKQENWIHSITY